MSAIEDVVATMNRDEIGGRLLELKEERRDTLRLLSSLKREMTPLVVAADKLGVSKLEISRLSGLTRQTIYGILLRDQIPT